MGTLLKVPATNAWSKHEVRKLAETDDLHISPFREDGIKKRALPHVIEEVWPENRNNNGGTL